MSVWSSVMAIVLTAGAVSLARAGEIDVFILAGQSNAGGHGYVSKQYAYFSAFKDPGLVEIQQTQWLDVQPDVWIYAQLGGKPTPQRPLFWDRRTEGWVPLKAGTDFLDASGERIVNHPFGVEVTFAAERRRLHPERPLAIIKYTRGATSLRTDWDPAAGQVFDLARPSGPGYSYAGLRRLVDEAMAALRERGETPVLRGVLWVQGESDAGMKREDYVERLQQLAAALRHDLQSPDLPIAVGELLQINPNFANLRRAQQEYVDSDPNAKLVSSEGLTADHTFGGKLHIDTASLLTFGQRFAHAFEPTPPATNPSP